MTAANVSDTVVHEPAVFTAINNALVTVFASGAPELTRLAYAEVAVALRITGDDATNVMLLNARPVKVEVNAPADVELRLDAELALRFLAGGLPMTDAVISGAVHTRGPVRRYLEVDPILRSLLRRAAAIAAPGEDSPALRTHFPAPRAGDRALRPQASAPMTTPAAGIDPDLLAIETRDLHKRFGSHHVLCGLDIGIPEGVVSVVLGPSGTGKSVLLQHIIGLLMPERGDVLIRGRSLRAMGRAELLDLRTEIGVMFQDGALFSAMTVYDNVAFPLRQHTDLLESEIHDVVMDHLTSVGLAAARDRMPNELSGGMRKRAGMARALVMNPGILLCDEPDSGLDPVRTALLGRLLIEQHALYGGTIVVVTHNVMLARQIGEHMSVVWQGRVLESGMADTILASGSEFIRQFLSGSSRGPLGMDA
jgi:phospholipid/cholesterol/gamma-HCH transport system ATP-binding protein